MGDDASETKVLYIKQREREEERQIGEKNTISYDSLKKKFASFVLSHCH